MARKLIVFLFCVISMNALAQDWAYLRQKPPGKTPQRFDPISRHHLVHSSPTFSSDGTEIYWSEINKSDDESHNIYYTQYTDGRWTDPAVAPFSSSYHDDQPFITYDGQRLFFASMRPKLPGGEAGWDLWFSTKTGDGWSDPCEVNDGIGWWTPSLTRNHRLYFMDLIGDGPAQGYPENAPGIFSSEFREGIYTTPELLPESVNGKSSLDWTPFIAADDSYLIFSSDRVGGYGAGDLYISFRDDQGQWGEAINLGPSINTHNQERFPGVSPDGTYLFFTRWLGPPHYHDLFWVEASVIHDLKKPSQEN